LKYILLVVSSLMVANAATITNLTDSGSSTANIQYNFTVNNGGNPSVATFLNGDDPDELEHDAVSTSIVNGLIVDALDLDVALTPSAVTSSRVTSYFTGVTQTYNPTFAANHSLQYTITVQSSAGSNSFTGTGSTLNLNVLSLANFAALLNSGATGRQIEISWQDTVDFLLPAAMPKDALPGQNNPQREYRWNVSTGVSGLTDLQLTLSEPAPPPPPAVPEPSTALLVGSVFVAAGMLGRRIKK
jgi:hypothetical protein